MTFGLGFFYYTSVVESWVRVGFSDVACVFAEFCGCAVW